MAVLRGAYALLFTLFQIVTTGVRVFALDSLRSGVVNLRPLSAAVRALVWAALLMVFAFLLSLLFSDALRESGGLQPLRIASSTARALLAPGLATPITLVAVLLAWSYILTGALHMRPLARWLAFLLFLIFGVQGLTSGLATAPALAVSLGLLAYAPFVGVGCALVLLLLCFIILPLFKTPLPPAIEFCTVLMLNALLFVPSIAQAAAARSAFGSPFTIDDHTYQAVFVARTALLPFVFIAGIEMANFAQSVGSWVAQAAQRHGARWVLIGLLFALLLYRFAAFAQAKISSGISLADAQAWLGAAMLLLGVGLIAGWRLRQPARTGAVPFRWLVGFVLAYMSGNILLLGALPLVVAGLVTTMGITNEMLAANNEMTGAIVSFSNTFSRYATLFVSALALLASWRFARRGRTAIQTFCLVLAWHLAWRWLTQEDSPLAALRFQYGDVDPLLTLVLFASAVILLARGQLDENRAVRLLGLTVLAALLNQTNFLDNPFSPLFGFAGIVFLAFGILWNVLTSGGRFLNASSHAFPRQSRVLVYFGYILLSVAIAHWWVVSHAVELQTQQSDFNLAGFKLFGLALAFWVFAERGEPLMSDG